MERDTEKYPDVRVGESFVKALKDNESLEYNDDDVLVVRIHEIGKKMDFTTEEEIRNKQIYDITQG